MLSSPPKKINHIGIAVHNLDSSVQFYTNVLGLKLLGIETVESEQVRIAFLEIGETKIELLEPLSQESAIAKHLEKRGEGIHHIALEVDGIEERLTELTESKIQLIHEEPKPGAHGSKIAFLHPKSTGSVLYELCEPTNTQNMTK